MSMIPYKFNRVTWMSEVEIAIDGYVIFKLIKNPFMKQLTSDDKLIK